VIKLILISIFFLPYTQAVGAEVYSCVGADGIPVISNAPCMSQRLKEPDRSIDYSGVLMNSKNLRLLELAAKSYNFYSYDHFLTSMNTCNDLLNRVDPNFTLNVLIKSSIWLQSRCDIIMAIETETPKPRASSTLKDSAPVEYQFGN